VTAASAVVVGPVIGEGVEAHRMVKVGPWTLTEWLEWGDQEPRLSDEDVARRLGFKAPRQVRELIKSIWPVEQRPNCRRLRRHQSTGNGASRVYEVTEFWLTAPEVLKLCARSKQPVAEAILDDMIRVYLLALRGLLVPADERTAKQLRAANDNLTAANARLGAENATLRRRTAEIDRAFTTGTIPGLTLRVSILDRIIGLTRLKTGLTGGKAFNAACSALHHDIKLASGVQGSWSRLPIGDLGCVTAAIDAEEHRLRRDARVRARSRQLALVPKPRTGSTG
jgi:hypothetical protein